MSQGWSKLFSRVRWVNRPSASTPLGATNLNKGDVALDGIDDRVIQLDTLKADMTTVNLMVSDVVLNSSNGVITVTYKNGETKTYDTKLEKMAVNFEYDSATQKLVITLDDGTKQYVDLSTLITEFEFNDTDTIAFSVTSGKVSAIVKDGSITGSKLEPNYLANCNTAVTQAQGYANDSATSASAASDSAEEADGYAQQAKGYKETAEQIVGSGIMTTSRLGLGKVDGTTITVDADGTLHSSAITDIPVASATTLGGIKVGNNLTIDSDGKLSAEDGGLQMVELDTMAEYNALSEAEKKNPLKRYLIKEATPSKSSAGNVVYGNSNVADTLTTLNQNLTNLEYGASYGGANIWNEKWVLGGLTWAGGAEYAASDRIRSTDYTPVKSNTSYYATTITQLALFFYDSSKAFISYKTDLTSNTFTTPSNAKYIKLVIQSATSYANNLSIIEGTSGTYVPYIPSVKQINDSLADVGQQVMLGFQSGEGILTLSDNIDNYRQLIIYCTSAANGRIEGSFVISPAEFKKHNTVSLIVGVSAYTTARKYSYCIYVSNTSVNVQTNIGFRIDGVK